MTKGLFHSSIRAINIYTSMQKKLLLSVLAVALLISGAVLVWQKKMAQEEDKNQNQEVVQENTNNEKYPQHIEVIQGSDEVWYGIPEYGVRMRLNREFAEDLIYSTEMTDDFGEKSNGIFFSTKVMTEVAPECSPERGNALGSVFKAKGNMMELAKTDEYLAARVNTYVQIGDYYYGWVGHQAPCWYPSHQDMAEKEWSKEYNGVSGVNSLYNSSKTFQLIPSK